MKAIKRPLPINVSFAAECGVLETLEGPVSYAIGDAILVGVNGERWPVGREEFAKMYIPLGGQPMFVDGDYHKRRIVVDAEQLNASESIEISDGSQLTGRPGDWLITGPGGDRWVVAADIFERTYKLLNKDC